MDEMTWIRSDIRPPAAEEIATGRIIVWTGTRTTDLPSEIVQAFSPEQFASIWPFWFLATDPTQRLPLAEED